MRHAAATLLLLASLPAAAQQRVVAPPPPTPVVTTIIPRRPWMPSPVPGGCIPPALLAGARVVALGANEGGTTTAFTFAGEPHDVGAIVVGADGEGPPLVVVLTAYDPAIWDLRAVPAKRLRAVLVRAHAAQAVAGVLRATPLRFGTQRAGSATCGEGGYVGDDAVGRGAFVADIETLLGHRVDAIRTGYDPVYLHLDHDEAGRAPRRPLRLADLRGSVPIRLGDVPPKDAGLRVLAARGAIRPAVAADRATLASVLARTGLQARTPMPGNAWVVTRAIDVPRGMYGANSATFLIAPGVAQPIDVGSHNTYYRLDTGACTGTGCGQ